jgi:oxalate---CoA ligase
MNYGTQLDCTMTVPSTISDAVRLQAVLYPDRLALVCAGLPAFSFSELNCSIGQIGKILHAADVGAASRVGVVLPNGPEAAIVAIAASAHAVCFPLSSALSATDFEFELTRANLDAVIFPDWIELPAMGPARASSIGIFCVSRAARSFADVRLQSVAAIRPERRRSGRPSAQSVALIQMSSGSTGTPKLILVTHANLFDIAEKMRTWFRLSENDRCACFLPIYSGFGFKIALLGPLLIGSSVALAKSQRAEDILEWCSDLNPTWFVAIPPFLNAALDKLRSTANSELKHSLRFFASTTAYLPESVRAGLEAILGIPGLELYGLREAGIVASNPAPPANRKPGSVGLITDDVAILSAEGEVLPCGTPGPVAVRGQGLSPGYIDALPFGSDSVPEGRASQDEWALTGDLGIIDADGFLSVIGRTKEIINRGGEKIAPSEIEKALLLHQAVREAVAFGVPHPRLGESVSAAVVLKTESEVTSSDLQSFLYERLASSKIPQRVYVVSTLPRTKTGKVQISELRNYFSDRDREIVPPGGILEILIVDIWERLLGRTDIGVDENFFELGGDSLLATVMLLEVEALTRRPISQSALRAVWTVRQLAAAVLRDLPAENELVTRVKNGSGTPFFFCHGDYKDRGIYAFRLTDLIEQDIPIFLLNHHRGSGGAGQVTVEDLARLYVPHLLASQPTGRFRIGGYCAGGILAWEIAHQLKQAGREVEFVVLIDSPSLNCRPMLRAAKNALNLISMVSSKRLRETLEFNGMSAIWVSIRSRPLVWGAIRKVMRHASARSLRKETYHLWLGEYRRISNYIPEGLDTELFCLICGENARRRDYRPVAWTRLAREVHSRPIPGDHHTCVTTFAGVLASELQGIFATRH